MKRATEHARALAGRLRVSPSTCEAALWRKLRDRELGGLKFRRQVAVGRYVADFICFRHRLIVEADEPFHHPAHDAERDAWLATQGFRVLRFTNAQVLGDTDVPLAILAAVAVPAADPLEFADYGE